MFEIYDIKDGESLSDVALKYDCTDDELCKINGFSKDLVLNGNMRIIVPVVDRTPYMYYTVKKEDDINDIAKEYDVDKKIILMLNGLDDGDYIYPNQTIMIPKKDIGIYLTGDDDTLLDVMNKLDIKFDDLIDENNNIYLKSEQFIFFKKKSL